MHPAEAVGRGDAERAARLALQCRRCLLGGLRLGEDAGAMAVVGGARLGHGKAARGAVEEARAQALLEALHMGADRGL